MKCYTVEWAKTYWNVDYEKSIAKIELVRAPALNFDVLRFTDIFLAISMSIYRLNHRYNYYVDSRLKW